MEEIQDIIVFVNKKNKIDAINSLIEHQGDLLKIISIEVLEHEKNKYRSF